MEYYEIIAERIRSLCRARGFSINALAHRAGLKQSTVDNIMHGASKNPRLQTLHKLAYAFNMTLAEFLDFPELNKYDFEDEAPDETSDFF